MESLFQIAALCVAAALLAVLIRQGSPVMGLLLTLAAAVTVLWTLTRSAGELFTMFHQLGERSGLSPTLLLPLYKTVGIALIVRTGGDLCRDAGESALGAVLEAAGTKQENVVKTLCFLTDMNDFAAFNEVYAKYFTEKPARSCVGVASLPKGARCEVEVVAAL